ncbi:MmgE/PrpD family protein [Candidimonas nitroreducens]|nr:MmgE/PrpD family protein [Candidimonas nitroreducens]
MANEQGPAAQAQSCSAKAADWYLGLKYTDLPDDIVARTKLHLLDVIGLALMGATRESGQVVRRAVHALGKGEECRILGYGDRTTALLAAIANGTMAHSTEFDDTHNEAIAHIANSVITTTLALSESNALNGRDAIAAIAGANEIACRVGVIAPGKMHAAGYHATGVIGTISASYLASRLLGLSLQQAQWCIGIAGSQAAGIMECWSDGTWSKFLHPGLAAHNALIAANLAMAGFTGPATVLEGRFGLLRSHVQDPNQVFDFERMVGCLGSRWESRDISFKPYPTAHFIHPFLDAIFALMHKHGIGASDVKSVMCPIAAHMIPIVCEPVEEKVRPASDWHGRVSLQYSIAEALYFGRLDGQGYAEESLGNPRILELAKKIDYRLDPDAPGRAHFKGWVIVETVDGRRLEHVEPRNRGSASNPMSADDIKEKFRSNARLMLDNPRVEQIVDRIDNLEQLSDMRDLIALCC